MVTELSILVADDHPVFREAAVQILEEAGHTVRIASDGPEALRRLGGGQFDALVTDVLMPGMDGIELITEVRRQYPGIQIIAMSGGGDGRLREDVLTTATASGAGAVLEKPFQANQLLERLQQLCPWMVAAT